MKNSILILSIVFGILISGCGASKATIDPYIGSWSLTTVDTPQGEVQSTMTITKSDAGIYSGTLVSNLGTFPLENLSILENKISADFVYQDIDFELSGTLTNNTFNGWISFMDGEYKTTGSKTVL